MHEGSINSKYIERSLCNFSSRDPREWDRFLKKCIWEFSNCEPAKYMLISTIFEYFCFAFFFHYKSLRLKCFLKHVLSCVWLIVTSRTVAHQAPLSMEFSRQEYWSGLLFPPPGDLPDPGLNPMSCISFIGRWVLYHWTTWEAHFNPIYLGLI